MKDPKDIDVIKRSLEATQSELLNVKTVLSTLIVWLHGELGELNVRELLSRLED